jgi:spermidine synthase
MEIGTGGGTNAGFLHASLPGAIIHSVDIEPVAVAAAKQCMGLDSAKRVVFHVADGREFVTKFKASGPAAEKSGAFDILLIDALDTANKEVRVSQPLLCLARTPSSASSHTTLFCGTPPLPHAAKLHYQ